MRPTRPSIMSDGATMSAPAAACDSAARASCSTVASLTISSPSSDAAVAVRRVLAQAHVGDDQQVRDLALERADGGLHRRLRDRRRRCPRRPSSSGRPKSSTPGTPSAFAAAASLTISSTDSWKTPGIDADFAPLAFAGARRTADRGSCRRLSRVSRTSARSAARAAQPARPVRRSSMRAGSLRVSCRVMVGVVRLDALARRSARRARRRDREPCSASA